MTRALPNPAFWQGRRVLVSGHTGFKGAWLHLWLQRMGALVTGLALPAPSHSLTHLARLPQRDDWLCDLRDRARVLDRVRDANADIIIHMAAQALVKESIARPQETFDINVNGTINLLEAARQTSSVRAILVVTSDKVYRNDNSGRRMREADPLGGKDPYSASKAACEIAAHAYRETYFAEKEVKVATARAGNVIGGGDFSADRIIPDIVRSIKGGDPLVLRHPEATRPWQHVLDCLNGYLLYAEHLSSANNVPPALNFGPCDDRAATVGQVVAVFGEAVQAQIQVQHQPVAGSKEALALSLDSSLARDSLGWRPLFSGNAHLYETAAWYRAYLQGSDMQKVTLDGLDRYLALEHA